MAEIVQAAPTFTVVGLSEAVAAEEKATIVLGTDDRQAFKLGFHAQILPAVIASLSTRLGELRPSADDGRTAPMSIKSCALAMTGDGTPAIAFETADGYDLVLSLPRDQLAILQREIGMLLNPQ